MAGEERASADPRSGRRELAVLLACGAAGAGLALLATRQHVARVVVTAPRPLPVTITPVSAQDLLPAASALAIAALASLAAVLATRGLPRRITGLITAALGVGLALTTATGRKAADVLAAAGHANLSPASGAGGGIAPGSTTAGTSGGIAGGSLAGSPAHVEFAGSAWRLLMLVGAVLIITVGCAIIARAGRLPAMSSRFERAGRPSVPRSARPVSPPAAAAASMWDSLNAGVDPTATPGDAGPD
ncbi:MAG TPA: Trp biosynthesis-associated membrane protein [Streptosporangiaceae bacterium]|nr:Trp biosynthesis-associated membrane protein [Streptosporangiaceae bacterium]